MRLIDADALLETGSGVKMIIPKNCHPYEAIKIQGKAFRAAVETAPTIDAVPVVRCKYCKHGELDESERDNFYLCHHHGCAWNDGEHFCSYGERKDND